jgi:hypothetical protein
VKLFADKEALYFVSGLQAVLHLAAAFHHEEAGAASLRRLLLQFQQLLYLWVLSARYQHSCSFFDAAKVDNKVERV